MIWGGGLGQYVGPERIQAFCERYHPLPMVNAALPLNNIPTVLIDNYQGMREVMLHLVREHHYQRIAFISGPIGHPEADDRYRAYQDVLTEHNLPVDDQLFAPGDFNPDSGHQAIKLFLDERHLRPGIDFQAVVAADDGMAMSAMATMQARGIRVPDDVAVAGFDNVEEGWYTRPTLTTVPILVHDQARQATELALSLLRGEQAPERILIPTRAVLRESCGCMIRHTAQSPPMTWAGTDETFEITLAKRRAQILSDMRKAVKTPPLSVVPQETERLLDAFLLEMQGESIGAFSASLEEVIFKEGLTSGSVAAWQDALSVLRSQTLPHLGNAQSAARAESLLQQARITIGETAERIQVNWRLQVEQRTGTVNALGQELLSTFDIPELTDTAAAGFNYLGIPASYIVLYENQETPTDMARLIMGYNRDGRIALEPGGQQFDAKRILPPDIFPHDKRCSMVVEPLYFHNEQLGFVLFDANPREAPFCDALRGHLSSAIKRALITKQHRQAETRLTAIHSLGQELVLSHDVNEIASLVVNAAQNVFQYPVFTLWLVNEKGGQLVHWTQSTDLDGVEFPPFSLDKENSIIATVIRSGNPIYLPDVSQDARYLGPPNPSGSELCIPPNPSGSELCIPLKVGDQIFGALNTESSELDYFSSADIQVLEALANSAAIAIHNARLHEEALQRADRLADANRTAQAAIKELEAFAYSVSHDLRAPLRSINGFSQALKEDYADDLDAEGQQMLERVRSASQRMGNLIDGMLQLSRLTRGNLELGRVDLSAMANDLATELQQANPTRQVEFSISPDLVARGDARLVRVMLANLLNNAWKFTQRKTVTRISFGRCQVDGETVYCVQDNGAGFDMAYVDKLFQAFQRLHAVTEFEGSGIGLATVQRIVHRHGGRAWAESKLGQGATFFFTLPTQDTV